MNDINQRVGEIIRDTRKRQGLSQRDFAKQLALSQDAVSDLETGARVLKITELLEIARVLSIPASTFLMVNEADAKLKLLDSCIKKLNKLPVVLLELVDTILDRFIRLISWVEDPVFGLRRIEIDLGAASRQPSDKRQPDIILSGSMILDHNREPARNFRGRSDIPDN